MVRSSVAAVTLFCLSMTAPQAADLPVKARPMPVAPAWAPTTSFYTFFDAVSYRSAFPGHEFRSHAYQSLTGLTYTVTPQWSVGGGMIYAWANSDLTYFGPGARSDTDQVTGFLTTAYDIPNLFTVGASGGIGKAWTDQVRLIGGLRSFAKYDADSWFASGYVSKNLRYGNLFLTPTVRLTARETNREAFTENTGIINPGEVSKAVELAYGGQIAYAIPTGRGWTFYPTAQVYGLHYFKLPLYQSDRDGLDLKLGASATVGNWSMGAAYMTILGIDSYRDYHGGRVFLTYNFGGPVSEPPRIGYGVTDDSLRLTGYTR